MLVSQGCPQSNDCEPTITKDLLGLMDRGGWVKADTANRYRKAAPDNLIEELQKYGWDFGQHDGQR